MNFDKISALFSAFNPQLVITHSERLHSGLSNDNFLIRTSHHAYLLKVYREHWPVIGLTAQLKFAELSICSRPLWTDQTQRIAIFEYIEGATAQSGLQPQLISKLVHLHQYSVLTEPMDIKHELEYYLATPIYQHYLSNIEHALARINAFEVDLGFCHNDLVKENIIENETGMYLIDFEYAKSNDVYFDLAALAVSFKLNEKQKIDLLTVYQNKRSNRAAFQHSMDKLVCFEVIFLVLCICWYSARNVEDKVTTLRAQLDNLIIKL
ncbi:phosphotransferase [Pseudoalteromonas sp. H105]|uniref:phosphotransferase n=1 Tax=Pseudoalteromonas sp. H105 TaxID=1348393 RepID=UPI0007321E17|nr:phosphotransferase [Pseudoalteromonas sp. H105]KTF15132.1 choline kinase [Pseudoalteromonas sp. H105]